VGAESGRGLRAFTTIGPGPGVDDVAGAGAADVEGFGGCP
jgi:hypothetical protein